MKIQQITMQDPLYQAERELRNLALLRPIGLPDYAWEKKDAQSFHLVAIQDGQVVGCVLLWPEQGTGNAQFLQMAVHPQYQRQGIGQALLAELRLLAIKQKYGQLFCHSRDTAIPFYLRAGLQAVGDEFTEVGVMHRKMVLDLAPKA